MFAYDVCFLTLSKICIKNKIDHSVEEVIRRRLLIDGDGIGDDRRLNVLLKSFIKWVNNPDTDHILHERMLSQLSQCEFAQKKSRLVSNMSQEELKNYENLSSEIDVEIEEAKKSIETTKVELQEAKQVRKNRIEYDVLAKVINEQPDRLDTDVKLATLQKELGKLRVRNFANIHIFFNDFQLTIFLYLGKVTALGTKA